MLFFDAVGRPLTDECWVPDLNNLDLCKSNKGEESQCLLNPSEELSSTHVSMTIPYKTSWLTNRIDFEELGWHAPRTV